MKTKNFRKKISLACSDDDLHPILQHIFFDEGYAIATDARLLLKQSLKDNGFTQDEISIMNGKYLHAEAFNEIFRCDMVTVSEDGFTCRKGAVKCLIEFSDIGDSKYPNWKAFIPYLNTAQPVAAIGINIKLLDIVNKITLSYTKALKFTFTAPNRGIIITPIDDGADEMILVMPARIH